MKDNITFPDFVKLDLRVGQIKEAERIQGSERLVKMQVDVGEEIGMRQIIAGIAMWYEVDDLIEKQVVVIVNLEPRKMMGFESQGMMMAAGDDIAHLLIPDEKVEAGTVVR